MNNRYHTELQESLSHEAITRALFENYESLYAVDIETSSYQCFHESEPFSTLRIENSGDDFFQAMERNVIHTIHPEDTPDDTDYYIHRAFDGTDSVSGVPFLDGRCAEKGNYFLIYGHNMKNKTMFGELSQYARQDYYEDHLEIRFDTLYETRVYQVIAVFFSQIYSRDAEGVFRYYDYYDLDDKAAFNDYLEGVRSLALYDTGFEAEYGDELLALSTCSYHVDNGRFVVVAKRVAGP